MIAVVTMSEWRDNMSSGEMPKEDELYCFIISSRAGKSRELSANVLRPAVESAGLTAISADNVKLGEQLASAIWSAIQKADLVLADISGSNPNVLYELGIAQGMGKRTIIVTDDYSNVPSDLSHLHIIRFEDSPKGLTNLHGALREELINVTREKRWRAASHFHSTHSGEAHRKDVARQEIKRAIESRRSGRLDEAIKHLEESLAVLGPSKGFVAQIVV